MLNWGEDMEVEVQITSLVGGMRLCCRMAERVAPPSLPVVEVRASILSFGLEVIGFWDWN